MPGSRNHIVQNAETLADSRSTGLVLEAVTAGIDAAHPDTVVRKALSVEDGRLRVGDETYDLATYDRIVVLGGGNAASQVAKTLEDVLGDWLDTGVVVTDDPVDTEVVDVFEGSHPVPGARAREGARAVLELAETADESTLVLGVITGGGSALLPAPAVDLELDDLRALTDAMLRSGAAIGEINTVRKHVSNVKGGQLARAAAPATTVGLLLSDVASDDPSVVASGPFSPDPTSYEESVAVLETHEVDVPAAILQHLREGVADEHPETPSATDPAFDTVDVSILANGFTALEAAASVFDGGAFKPLILSSSIRGEAREAAMTQVAIAEEIRRTGHPVETPAVLLSGGETTVTVAGDGTGGPNQEFALAAALEIPPGVVLASVDTDGIDGNTEAAGALVYRETARPAEDARAALDANDVHSFLADRDALVFTGPTGTNVNDLRVVLVPEQPDGDG